MKVTKKELDNIIVNHPLKDIHIQGNKYHFAELMSCSLDKGNFCSNQWYFSDIDKQECLFDLEGSIPGCPLLHFDVEIDCSLMPSGKLAICFTKDGIKPAISIEKQRLI
jgi:hypothetical protein